MPYTALIAHRRRKRSGFRRWLLALWRDTSALWREFNRPILIFLLVTIGGGFVYGELHEFSGREPLALIDRPYIMLQLMILETPYDAPEEWYLIIYWYLLPFVAIFILGDGVAEFVRLFLNRDERNGWREALVSTYRNHVIVFGAGHVGLRVVRVLAEMDLEVVVLDNQLDEEKKFVLGELDVPIILGDGRNPITLDKAGIRFAEAFVACTGDDHVNLETIMRVRQIRPDIRIVVRVWDDMLGAQMRQFIKVESVLSSSGLSAPIFAGLALGVEMTQSINIDGEDFSTIKLVVSERSFMAGRSVGDLQREEKMDIVLIGHNGITTVQPPHDVIVQAGDTVVIFAKHERSLAVAARNHQPKKR